VVSGGLAIRDFDKAGAYASWAAGHPKLADRLPTVKTPRGFHVYFRSRSERFCTFEDGELRGDAKHYTLLPPSPHPSGAVYRWTVPLDGALPRLDPAKAGLLGASGTAAPVNTENTENTEGTPTPPVFSVLTGFLPSGPGQRHRCLFRLARALKADPAWRDAAFPALRPVVEEWHHLALPRVRTKPFVDSWADFISAWELVRFPEGSGPAEEALARAAAAPPPARAVALYGGGAIVVLAGVCRELQALAADGWFYLDCRRAGELIGTSHVQAWKHLKVLCADGILEGGAKGSQAGGKANEYRYVGD
jgi:hypothetical protein